MGVGLWAQRVGHPPSCYSSCYNSVTVAVTGVLLCVKCQVVSRTKRARTSIEQGKSREIKRRFGSSGSRSVRGSHESCCRVAAEFVFFRDGFVRVFLRVQNAKSCLCHVSVCEAYYFSYSNSEVR